MNEVLRRYTEGELNERFPQLQETTKNVANVVGRYFKQIRPDLNLLFPPLLILKVEDYKKNLSVATRNSTRINRTADNSPFAFEALSGTLHTNLAEVEYYLASNERKIVLNGIIAEEYIHALTTFKEGKNVRVGFTELPFPQRLHKLKPGGIYEFNDLPLPGDAPSPRENPADIELTESATELAVNLLYPTLCPEMQDFNVLIFFNGVSDKSPLLIPLDSLPVRRVLDALARGSRDSLRRLNPTIYEALNNTDYHQFLYSNQREGVDGLFSYRIRNS